MAKIVVKFKGMVRQEYPLVNPITAIGRNPTNDIPIDNLAVSRFHSQIVREGSDYFIEDLDSNNGTQVNGETVKKHQLKDGDVITVGKHQLEYHVSDFTVPTSAANHHGGQDEGEMTMMLDTRPRSPQPAPPPAPPPAAPAGRPAAPAPMAGRSGASPVIQAGKPGGAPPAAAAPAKPAAAAKPVYMGTLNVVQGDLPSKKYELTSPATTIGKGVASEIRLSGMLTPSLAVVINRRSDGYTITPATGGMFRPNLNGSPLDEPKRLNDGDMIEIRGYRFQFNLRKGG